MLGGVNAQLETVVPLNAAHREIDAGPCPRPAGLIDELLIERHAEQPDPPLNPELEALLPF